MAQNTNSKVLRLTISGGRLYHLSIAYSLSNICTKNYWNPTTIIEIIVGGWVVSFFETKCIYKNRKRLSICLCHGLSEHQPSTQRQTALLRPIYPVSAVVGS